MMAANLDSLTPPAAGGLLIGGHEGADVRPISIHEAYALGALIAPLGTLSPDDLVTEAIKRRATQAMVALTRFGRNVVHRRNVCKGEWVALLGVVRRGAQLGGEWEIGHPAGELATLVRERLDNFDEALRRDASKLHTYIIDDRRGWTPDVLLTSPRNLLGNNARRQFTGDLGTNWAEVGKCLAIGSGTAAAYHALRVCEDLIRSYFRAVTGKPFPAPPPPKPSRKHGIAPFGTVTLRAYISGLHTYADERVITSLQALRATHRNPLMHPGGILEIDHAESLLSLCVGVVDAIANDMHKRRRRVR